MDPYRSNSPDGLVHGTPKKKCSPAFLQKILHQSSISRRAETTISKSTDVTGPRRTGETRISQSRVGSINMSSRPIAPNAFGENTQEYKRYGIPEYSSQRQQRGKLREPFTTERSSSKDIIIAVMGKTGSGKSSFISKLAIYDYTDAIGHGIVSRGCSASSDSS
jgi:hypothetical protein